MTTANIAEVLKLAAKLVQHDNDEKTWLEFRFKLENYLTLVDEKFVSLLQDAESQAAKFEETWKSWEHHVDVYEYLSSSKLDDDVKISVVLREAPQKLRDYLLVNSQQFERNCGKLRAIIQAYLNTNKTWIANDFRETDPMAVDFIGKSKGKGKSKSKSKGNRKGNSKGGSKDNGKGKSKGKSKDRNQGKGKSNSNS